VEFDDFGSGDLPQRLMAGDEFTAPGVPVSYSFPLGSEQHEAGTLPLGGPVVDERSQVRAIGGLFAAGPCTFPRGGAAHPVMTIMALSVRLARSLPR
jgi:choline dehydrogenase-like flavoprotein